MSQNVRQEPFIITTNYRELHFKGNLLSSLDVNQFATSILPQLCDYKQQPQNSENKINKFYIRDKITEW